jgi:hypothetical protein
MIGMPAMSAANAGNPSPAGPTPGPVGLSGGKQTMIGMASPTGASASPPHSSRAGADHKRTMLGVAMPGIAPLAPGVPKEPIASVDPPFLPPTGQWQDGHAPQPPVPPAFQPPVPPAFQPPAEHRHRSTRPPSTPRPQTSAAVALVSGLVLAAGAAAFAFFWRSPAPLRAEARVDSSGADLLHITCTSCPDGTELGVGKAKAKVTSQVADITLAAPLNVGENFFTVDLDRPENGRDEKIALVVKIGYRIRPDLSALDSDRPALRILVDGAPLAKMVIDGKPFDLGPDGKGKYDLDVTADCTGLTDEARTLERLVSYSVAGSNGVAEQGVVGLRVAVTPLRVDSPTPHAVVEGDHFLLGGRTARGSRLLAANEPIATAPDGTFSKSIAARETGDNVLSLRAIAPGQAPRIATLRVKRVEHLADEARDFSAGAPLTFADLTADVTKHVGEPVVLAGDVLETRQQGVRNLALLDVVKGCPRPPCVARIAISASDVLARGDHLQVFGHVTGAVTAKSETTSAVPEVEGDFFLKRR